MQSGPVHTRNACIVIGLDSRIAGQDFMRWQEKAYEPEEEDEDDKDGDVEEGQRTPSKGNGDVTLREQYSPSQTGGLGPYYNGSASLSLQNAAYDCLVCTYTLSSFVLLPQTATRVCHDAAPRLQMGGCSSGRQT